MLVNFWQGVEISVDSTYRGINVTQEPCVSGLLETEVRDDFMQSGTLKLLCCKHGGSQQQWSRLSGLSVDKFQDLPIQFEQVLKAKSFNRCWILPVGLGGSTLIRKSMKWESGVFPCHGTAELRRIPFGHEGGKRRLVLIKWGKGSEKKISRRILRCSQGACC